MLVMMCWPAVCQTWPDQSGYEALGVEPQSTPAYAVSFLTARIGIRVSFLLSPIKRWPNTITGI